MEKQKQTWISHSVAETIERGRLIGKSLVPGMSVALVGELGSGKTVLVKGIALGLGVARQNDVRSPTFVLFHMYQGRIPLYHFDFYRLNQTMDLEELGMYDYLSDPEAVSVVEWADRVPDILNRADLRIRLSFSGEQCRTIEAARYGHS